DVVGHEKLQSWRRLGVSGYLAWGLENLALTAAMAGEGARAERAARLLGAAARLRERVGAPLRRRQWQSHMERAKALARAALGEERWAAAYAAGEGLSLGGAGTEGLGGTTRWCLGGVRRPTRCLLAGARTACGTATVGKAGDAPGSDGLAGARVSIRTRTRRTGGCGGGETLVGAALAQETPPERCSCVSGVGTRLPKRRPTAMQLMHATP